MKLCIQILLLLFFTVNILAQTTNDSSYFSVPTKTKFIRSVFDKQLNTSNLHSGFNYNHAFNKWNFWVTEDFISTVIQSNSNSIKDENYFSIGGSYLLSSYFELGMRLKNSIYSDDRQVRYNEAAYLNTVGFAKINPAANMFFTGYGGVSFNQQVGERDQGPIYGFEGVANNLNYTDFTIDASLKFQNEDISPRKNTLRNFDIKLNNEFQGSILNQISSNYIEQRKDFYFEADSIISNEFEVNNNIQSRTESNFYLQDRLIFLAPNSPVQFNLQARVNWREIDRNTRYISLDNIDESTFDTKIDEFRLDLASMLEYRWSTGASSIKVSYTEREETHQAKDIKEANRIIYEERNRREQQKSNRSDLVTLSMSAYKYISTTDRIIFSLFHRKLTYDTPSDENNDDRDEVLSLVKFGYSKQMSPIFNLFANIEGSLNHIVYIFKERSANNNITRSLKLSAGGQYQGKIVRSTNIAEVSANYTSYDFEEVNPLLQSFSFRQYVLKDSTTIKLTRNVSAKFNGYIKLSEQGIFNWDNFSGKPNRLLQEIYIEPLLVNNYQSLSLGIGLRYFSLDTYVFNKTNEKKLSSEYKSLGPLTEITYYLNSKIDLRLYGFYEFITNEDGSKRNLTNINLRINWNI